jgi:hypothetical protein
MKKILVIGRQSADLHYITSQISLKLPSTSELGLLLETGENARIQKLKRMFRSKTSLEKIMAFIDALSITLYRKVYEWGIKKKLKPPKGYGRFEVLGCVPDINHSETLKVIQQFHPNLILNYGTAIYKEATLEKIKKPIFNIHTSVLPAYRNVHSDFWAFLHNDYTNIGATIFKIDKGIDSGPILTQKSLNNAHTKTLLEIKTQNLTLICELILSFIEKKEWIETPQKPQNTPQPTARFSPTPTTKDLVQLLKRKKGKLWH